MVNSTIYSGIMFQHIHVYGLRTLHSTDVWNWMFWLRYVHGLLSSQQVIMILVVPIMLNYLKTYEWEVKSTSDSTKPAIELVQALTDISRSALYAFAVYKAISLHTSLCMLWGGQVYKLLMYFHDFMYRKSLKSVIIFDRVIKNKKGATFETRCTYAYR